MNPYALDQPSIIHVSGGRTSGFMLAKIIEAFGGALPADVIPVFCNTGLEHEATYQFLRELSNRWTPIVWLEYRRTSSGENGHSFAVVDYCSAARKGEPFSDLIAPKPYLPNPVARYCTADLKLRTVQRYTKSLGWEEYESAVGLRADEPRRVARIKGDTKRESVVCPIARAGHTIDDVLTFWKSQPFDLMLPGGSNLFGNCVGCFLKGRGKLERIMQTNPEHFDWWMRQESGGDRLFRIDRPTYRQMMTGVSVQGRLLDDAIEDDTEPCHCTD